MRSLAAKKPFFKNKFQKPGGGVRPPPRNVADLTCPNCNEKGHLGQDCPTPKVDLKARKCFICGATGCVAKTCPNRKETAKALTGGAGGVASVPVVGQVWLGCVSGSCQEPARRDNNRRRLQSWKKATAAKGRGRGGGMRGENQPVIYGRSSRFKKTAVARRGGNITSQSLA